MGYNAPMANLPNRPAPRPSGQGASAGRLRVRALPSAVVLGTAFACFLVVGRSFAETGGLGLISESPALALAALVALAAAFSAALCALFAWLDRRAARPAPERRPRTRLGALCARHPFAAPLAVLAVCWGAYLVVFAPGTLTWDGARSLNQFCAGAYLENHHPVLMNLLYAALMGLGRLVGSDNWGVALITWSQTAALACTVAAVVSAMARLRAPAPLMAVSTAYFALFPAWGVLAQDAIKDTLFCAVFGLFALRLALVLPGVRTRDLGRTGRADWAALFACAALVALTRNNGIYIVAPSLLLAALVRWRAASRAASRVQAPPGAHARAAASAPRRRAGLRASAGALAALVGTCVVYVALTSAVYPAMGVDMRNEKEMLSIPFQQTARTVLSYPDDVEASERAAIDGVLPADRLAELYDPDLADPVKEEYKLHNGKVEGSYEYAEEHPDALRDYLLEAWLPMGLRHPGTYVAATVANTYAYFYPFELVDCEGNRPILLVGSVYEPINLTYDVGFVMPEGLVQAANALVQASTGVPVLNVLYSPAPYVWLLLVAAFYLLHARRLGALCLCVPPLMLLLTVLAGPLNGHLRYVMPLIVALPLIWAVVLKRRTAPAKG